VIRRAALPRWSPSPHWSSGEEQLRFLHYGDRCNATDDHELVLELNEPLAELRRAGDHAKTSSSRSRSAPSSLGSPCPCRDKYSDNGSTAAPAPPKRVE
jgi:hypothetical protein